MRFDDPIELPAPDKTMPMIKAVHQCLPSLRDTAAQMEGLARNFRRVGNDSVADELVLLAGLIRSDAKQIAASFDYDLTGKLEQVHGSTGNMLRACLAGGELGAAATRK